MHEYSIIQSLFDLIEKHVADNRAKSVAKVKVRIGKLSGVEPHFLKIAFDTFKENTVARSAEFEMEIKDVLVRCEKCERESILEEFIFLCPLCESSQIKVLEGEEMYLDSLELEK
jgi:hydrogenase nickel incorporation protein HypA/HybF